MKTINNLIYGYIVGDSFGLSKLNISEFDNEVKLKFNESLNIEKGTFSIMTTNLLATMDSIGEIKDIDIEDILNKLCTSMIVGKYTTNGKVYCIDDETLNVLNYFSKKNNFNYILNDNNLSAYPLSRVIPICIYDFYTNDLFDNLKNVISITSDNEIVHLGCYILYKYIINLMEGKNKYKSLKIKIPSSFSNELVNNYKRILKGQISYNDLIFDDNIINVLNIVFYVILNSDNYLDMFNMISNFEGNINIYSSLICSIGGLLYGKENIPNNLVKDLKNKKDINKYIRKFERVFI